MKKQLLTLTFLILNFPIVALPTPSSVLTEGTKPSGEIAFATEHFGDKEIVILDTSSGQIRNLTENPASDNHPAWSPDGLKLAFDSNRNGNYEIFVMDISSGVIEQITYTGGRQPVWSPDGKQLAWTGDENDSGLFVANAKGDNPKQLVSMQGVIFSPKWSPDGRYILFGSQYGSSPNVYLAEVDTGVMRLVTGEVLWQNYVPFPDSNAPTRGFAYHTWLPDSSQIAFGSIVGGPVDILVADIKGEEFRVVTNGFYPAWSVDGQMIAFLRFEGQIVTNYGIYVMNADGTEIRRIGGLGGWEFDFQPFTWIPDSDWLAVISENDETDMYDFRLVDTSSEEQWSVFLDSRPPVSSLAWRP
ncbi:MAG: PD40 domain-containing protein [Chloroflexi bacterium]|nr:PD40 domain-containing protein [Chloroflexota bacterium]